MPLGCRGTAFLAIGCGLSLAGPPAPSPPPGSAPPDAAPVRSSRAIGAKPSPDPPAYVAPRQPWWEPGPLPPPARPWLLAGLEHRSRFAAAANDYLSGLPTDRAYLSRTLVYVGIRDRLDPFRCTLEIEDSRRAFSDFPRNPRQTNTADFLQAWLELRLEPAGTPASLRAGRMTLDFVDRRLVARNRFRNSANAFDGLRLRLGDPGGPWVADLFATRPVEPRAHELDRSRPERLLAGGSATLRNAAPDCTLEPYYLYFSDERAPGTAAERHLHTFGLHAFGQPAAGRLDYDLGAAVQLGDSNRLDHRAWALRAELGYSFDHPWNPRLAAWVNYATGDRDPDDDDHQRFSQLFGSAFGPYGFTRYFSWENILNPAVHLSLRPRPDLRFEAFLRGYWLASASDAWVRTGRRDPDGDSGRHLGRELDLRLRWQATENLLLDAGYAHFLPGSFVERTGPDPASRLAYLQFTWNL